VSAVITGTGRRDDLLPSGSELRSGFPYWMDSLRSMLRYDWGGMRPWVGMMVVIQTMMGAGMVLMYGFFYPQITTTTALYIATGAPTLALIPLGFVMVPNAVMMDKLHGTFDYVWSMPVPRSAHAVSTFSLFTVLAVPGMVLALLVAIWRYGIHLSLSPVLIPAVLLCALMSVTVGYALALAVCLLCAAPLSAQIPTRQALARGIESNQQLSATELDSRIAHLAPGDRNGEIFLRFVHLRNSVAAKDNAAVAADVLSLFIGYLHCSQICPIPLLPRRPAALGAVASALRRAQGVRPFWAFSRMIRSRPATFTCQPELVAIHMSYLQKLLRWRVSTVQ